MHLSEEDFFGDYFDGFPIDPTDETLAVVRAYCLERWQERHIEEGGTVETRPTDLAGACKFTSLFGSVVFGADIGGNYDHVFNVLAGRVLDINAEAADVKALAKPYQHDDEFIGSEDFQYSMDSCVRRVEDWVFDFAFLLDEKLLPQSDAGV